MTAPLTYKEAAAQARDITWEEFAEIISTDDNPYVYARPHSPRRIAMNVRVHLMERRTITFASYDYCNRNGFNDTGSNWPNTVWHFDSVGTVTVPRKATS